MQKAFIKVKDDLNERPTMRESFYYVRDNIHEVVRSCATNVRVVIYFDDVLDEPIHVKSGREENRLRITINSDGTSTYAWTKQTWAKVFLDVKENVKSITQTILTKLASLLRGRKPKSIENKKQLPITASTSTASK